MFLHHVQIGHLHSNCSPSVTSALIVYTPLRHFWRQLATLWYGCHGDRFDALLSISLPPSLMNPSIIAHVWLLFTDWGTIYERHIRKLSASFPWSGFGICHVDRSLGSVTQEIRLPAWCWLNVCINLRFDRKPVSWDVGLTHYLPNFPAVTTLYCCFLIVCIWCLLIGCQQSQSQVCSALWNLSTGYSKCLKSKIANG